MQVVAVTDPLELGFARQAMVGVRVTGPLEPVADAIAELDEVDYVVVTAGSYDLLVEVVCESDEHLLELISGQIRTDRGRRRDRDVHVPPACASRPTRGVCAEPPRATRTTSGSRSGTTPSTTDWTPRPALDGDVEADVAIVGAGFTGLWTAHYLAEADPALRIVVLEAETAGFGASGRNGGWCSALFPASLADARRGTPTATAALAQHRAMRQTVDEVVRVAAAEGIDADVAQGRHDRAGPQPGPAGRAPGPRSPRPAPGTAARTTCACSTARRRPRSCAAAAPAARRTPPTARRIHPARLVRGLADAVERRGVTHPRADPGHRDRARAARTPRTASCGPRTCSARPRATPPRLRRRARARGAGLLADHRDRAAAAGGLGRDRAGPARDVHRPPAPDHLRPAHRRRPAGLRRPRRAVPPRLADPAGVRPRRAGLRRGSTPPCVDLFPVLAGTRVTHAWGGALGIPRDWCASVGLDRDDRARLGRRVRRRRRQHHQPRRPHAARPGPRPRHRADPAALGRPPLPRLGAASRCAGSASTPGCAR